MCQLLFAAALEYERYCTTKRSTADRKEAERLAEAPIREAKKAAKAARKAAARLVVAVPDRELCTGPMRP